jgi:DNA-directed RNA polymerase III subunit RPC3
MSNFKQEDNVVRINHEKFLVVFRNAELVSLADSRLGKVTSQVYAQFLKHLEPMVYRCRDNFGEDDGEDDDDGSLSSKKSMLEIAYV